MNQNDILPGTRYGIFKLLSGKEVIGEKFLKYININPFEDYLYVTEDVKVINKLDKLLSRSPITNINFQEELFF